MKKCITCGASKPLTNFYKHKVTKSGYRSKCKECSKEQSKKWRKNNPEKAKECNKKYRQNNPEKIAIGKKEWADNNPKKVKKTNKRFWLNNPDYQKDRREKVKVKYGISLATIQRYGLKLALKIYDKYDRKCSECGEEDDLTIHHLDGKGINYENQGLKPNNSEDNLIVLCNRCHGGLHSRKYWASKKTKEQG